MFNVLLLSSTGMITLAAVGAVVFFWRKKQNRAAGFAPPVLTEWDRTCMAYHEAGHAVCSRYLPEREKLLRITIDPSDTAFGMIRTAPRPHHNETEKTLFSTICTLLAGRLSEEKFLGVKTTGCIYDLDEARNIALSMSVKFGMGKRTKLLAAVSIHDDSFAMLSETSRKMADEDTMEIIANAEAAAREQIDLHAGEVRRLAAILLTEKTLSPERIEAFFSTAGGEVKQ